VLLDQARDEGWSTPSKLHAVRFRTE